MPLSKISLNLLRAFDASARHLSFTKASKELFVTQAAVAHQVKTLEDYLQKPLFNRAARTLSLTDEGASLAPIVAKSLYEIGVVLETIRGKERKSVLHVGVVGTFALGFLLERMDQFHANNPNILVKIQVNNNVPDLLNEHLDFAIRFGEGAWLAQTSQLLIPAPLSPLCDSETAAKLQNAIDLTKFPLLRSHRKNEWGRWFGVFGKLDVEATGTIFDNSRAIADAAKLGLGVGLLPYQMFSAELGEGSLVKPFAQDVHAGAYYLTHLVQRPITEAMLEFRDWLLEECEQFTRNNL